MRYRYGNPFRDQHGPQFNMHVYDFVARPADPHGVSQAIEYVVADLTCFGRGTVLKERVWRKDHFEDSVVEMQDYDPNKQGWVNSAVWTSWQLDLVRDEPCLYVALGCYSTQCLNNLNCIAGHRGYTVRQAPRLVAWQLDAIKEEIGEHLRLRLGVRQDKDIEVLRELGFTALDAPLKLVV